MDSFGGGFEPRTPSPKYVIHFYPFLLTDGAFGGLISHKDYAHPIK